MSLITAHRSGVSARPSRYTVKGSPTVGFMRCQIVASTRRRGAYVVVTARERGGHWEGFEAEPDGSSFSGATSQPRGPVEWR